MKSQIHMENQIAVIDISGKILGGPDATMFHGIVQQQLNRGGRSFIIDLERVERINSVGLGMLVSAHHSIGRNGGRMVLANITNVESVLSITRLINVLEAFDTREEAIGAFQDSSLSEPGPFDSDQSARADWF